MSEQEKPAEPAEKPDAEGAKPDEQLGEAGLNALKSERVARAAAEKAAADALARVKEFEDRDKTEQQKQDEALAAAKAELAELTVAKTRAEVANTKGVPADLVAGPASNSPEDIAKFADALIAFKGTAPNGPVLPDQGKSPTTQANTERDFIKGLFGAAD